MFIVYINYKTGTINSVIEITDTIQHIDFERCFVDFQKSQSYCRN